MSEQTALGAGNHSPDSVGNRQVTRALPVPIRTVWPNESADFTPWLADHLEWLAEDLGLGPLTLEGTEVPIPGGRWLDLLATNEVGHVVAIENQYGVTDHDHMTRALAYAVAMQSSDRVVAALVVVAEDHRDEFVAVADYLNECAAARGDQGIPVFLAKVSVEQIAGSPPAVRFTAVTRPNDWEEAARASQTKQPTSEADFLAGLNDTERPIVERILSDWTAREGRWVTTGVDSLVLFVRNDRVPQRRCNVASFAGADAKFWLNPGRLTDSLALTEDDLVDLQQLIVSHLPPTITQGGKGYYLTFRIGELDVERTGQLLDWVSDKLHPS